MNMKYLVQQIDESILIETKVITAASKAEARRSGWQAWAFFQKLKVIGFNACDFEPHTIF